MGAGILAAFFTVASGCHVQPFFDEPPGSRDAVPQPKRQVANSERQTREVFHPWGRRSLRSPGQRSPSQRQRPPSP